MIPALAITPIHSLVALRRLPVALAVVSFLSILAACSEEKHSYVANLTDDSPTMSTLDVNTFISDSGYTRYFITTPIWNIYDEAKEPYWKFPQGIELEQYDLNLKPASNMRCDSAKYLSNKRIWQLDGNVVMVNVDSDSFLTQQVFWDQVHREVYSDSFVHIVRSDRIIEGYGFTSNESMTRYSVNRPTGIFPVERALATASSDSSSASPSLRERHGAPVRASERIPESSPELISPSAPRGLENQSPTHTRSNPQKKTTPRINRNL